MKNKRVLYLDLIRVIAVYLVIFTHTGNLGSKLYEYGEYSFFRDVIYITADVFRRINVPLFFMVSGALMLGKTESYRDILFKRIIKYVLVIVSMSAFYFIIFYKREFDISIFMKEVYQGNVIGLFWFLYAYIGYLLILPFLRKVVHNMCTKDYVYLLIIAVLFNSMSIPASVSLLSGLRKPTFRLIGNLSSDRVETIIT